MSMKGFDAIEIIRVLARQLITVAAMGNGSGFFDCLDKAEIVRILAGQLITVAAMAENRGLILCLFVRLLMLLLAAKGLLLAVYGGRTVERDNFSHQQPPQTHRQERLTNKDEIYVECGRIIGELAAMAGLLSEYSEFPKKNRGKAVCILAWQLTKVAAMSDVFLLRLPRSRLQKIAPHSMATSGSTERWAAASLSESHPVREIEREGCKEVESGQGKYTKQASALDLILRLNNHRSYSDSHNQRAKRRCVRVLAEKKKAFG
ncbi:hypothetical protein Tco_1270983, partial [Tanacetum coccineum]